jgi:hypothetical protein
MFFCHAVVSFQVQVAGQEDKEYFIKLEESVTRRLQ